MGLRMSGWGGGVSAACWGLRSSSYKEGLPAQHPLYLLPGQSPAHPHRRSVSCSTSLSDFRPVLVLYSRERGRNGVTQRTPEPNAQSQSRVREPTVLCIAPISGRYHGPVSLSTFPVIIEPNKIDSTTDASFQRYPCEVCVCVNECVL